MRGNRLAAMLAAVVAGISGVAQQAKQAMGTTYPSGVGGHMTLRHRGINGGRSDNAALLKRAAKRRRNIRARAPK